MSINLLPDKLRMQRLRQHRLRIWLMAVAVVVAGITGWAALKYYGCFHAAQVTEEILSRMDEVHQEMDSLKQVKSELDVCRDRYMLLAELDAYYDYSFIIDFLSRYTPEMIYLERMRLSPELQEEMDREGIPTTPLPKGAEMFLLKESTETPAANQPSDAVNLQLTGTALNYEVVSDYLEILRDCHLFQFVDLRRSGRSDKGTAQTVEFEIHCSLWPVAVFSELQYAYMQKTQNL